MEQHKKRVIERSLLLPIFLPLSFSSGGVLFEIDERDRYGSASFSPEAACICSPFVFKGLSFCFMKKVTREQVC